MFFGRFLAILRAWAAFLAGANHMRRRTFFIWNAAGGILWATIYGSLGYILGNNLPLLGRILKGLGIFGFVALGVIVVALIVVWYVRHRRQKESIHRIATERNTPATPDSNASPDTPVPVAANTEPSSPDHTDDSGAISVAGASHRSRHTRRRQAYR